MKAILNLCSALVLMLFAAVPSANAIAILPSVVYDLTSNHCSVPADCGAPGTVFGTVTLTQNLTTVDVDVQLNVPYAFANTGAVDNQAFIFNGVGVSLADISVAAQIPALLAGTGPFGTVPLGFFTFGISCPTCGGGLSGPLFSDIVFHVANATIADLTVPNLQGNVFIADIGNVRTGATGAIDATIPEPEVTPHTQVPEPASLAT